MLIPISPTISMRFSPCAETLTQHLKVAWLLDCWPIACAVCLNAEKLINDMLKLFSLWFWLIFCIDFAVQLCCAGCLPLHRNFLTETLPKCWWSPRHEPSVPPSGEKKKSPLPQRSGKLFWFLLTLGFKWAPWFLYPSYITFPLPFV